jgi:hypothetical protein
VTSSDGILSFILGLFLLSVFFFPLVIGDIFLLKICRKIYFFDVDHCELYIIKCLDFVVFL